ncbi:hypothetical protein Deba_0213 [Desulfarculus baarsii DSM 2075]|uniref:Uncharacterized protein n=1 Tax=Desulfarculus baarsii (strain ATCC 33931 / DSM 2075 / LMG 7858 / VKM B-1802 / 2st14) TaxID=644282 RepID=E1QG78_DESB2|nr:hypothetical protein [Desulfarculus baarsii]ADK83590.1 hypothetical protein Deba_0213 [Desulfarculus baarsii DSM 2075]
MNCACRTKETELTGLLIPVEWDRAGNVEVFAIASYDETVHRLLPGELRKEMMTLLRREVTVWGDLTESGGEPALKVKRFAQTNLARGRIFPVDGGPR